MDHLRCPNYYVIPEKIAKLTWEVCYSWTYQGDAHNRLRSHVEERVKKIKPSKPGKKQLSADVSSD
ncbi:hypothetical protein KIN20_015688, partial [Parelaphostrongylus tenuis]